MIQNSRNYHIDVFKVFLALLVVYIHFPPSYYEWIKPIASCAVPVFFIISGYYLFRDDNPDRVKKTIKRIFKLTLIWGVIYLLYDNLFIARWQDFIIYSPHELVEALLFNRLAHGHHLWYLSSYYYALAAVWLFYRFNLMRYSNIIVLFLFVIHLLVGYYSENLFGYPLPFYYARNGILWALPMLLVGRFIRREVQLELLFRYRHALWMILLIIYVGNILNIEMLMPSTMIPNIPTILMTIALFLLVLCAGNGTDTIIARVGREYTLYIYILHMFFLPIKPFVYGYIPWLDSIFPIIIWGMSLLLSIGLVKMKSLVQETENH